MSLEDTLRLRICQCFQGPVHQAFIFAYYHTYTQDTDVLAYSKKVGLRWAFTDSEIAILEREKRPNYHSLSLLYKILQTCCEPCLKRNDSPYWNSRCPSSNQNRAEYILFSLFSLYKEFLKTYHSMSKERFDYFIENLGRHLAGLLPSIGKQSGSGSSRWAEEEKRLAELFMSIKTGKVMEEMEKDVSEALHSEAALNSDRLQEIIQGIGVTLASSPIELVALNKDQEKTSSEAYVEAIDLLSYIQNSHSSETSKRICLISGEHGIGKSCLAALLAISWNTGDRRINKVGDYEMIVLMSGQDINKLSTGTFQEILLNALPMSCASHGLVKVSEFLGKAKVLFIVDDVDSIESRHMCRLYKLLDFLQKSCVLLFGRMLILEKVGNNIVEESVLLKLNGFRYSSVIEQSLCTLGEDESLFDFQNLLEQNLNRVGSVLQYPKYLQETVRLWRNSANLLNNLYTGTELMWFILLYKAETIFGKKEAKSFLLEWIKVAGEIALCCFKTGDKIDSKAYQELEEESIKEFGKDVVNFLQLVFQPRLLHSTSSQFSGMSSLNHLQVEFLASYFVLEKLIKRIPYSEIIPSKLVSQRFILFVAGHFRRVANDKKLDGHLERKIISTLCNYKEESFEDLYYIYRLVAELRCVKKYVELIVDCTEYPEEWNLPVAEIQIKPLTILLEHVRPIRLILLHDHDKKNYELLTVLSYVGRVNVSLWLDSTPQFDYGNITKMDDILKPLLNDKVVSRVDLLSGIVSSSILNDLMDSVATKHLVMLRLRITNEPDLLSVLNAHKHLPKLLWLEIKIDMNLADVDLFDITPTDVSLMDVHLRNVNDTSVTHIADLLARMHKLYSGIHLEETDLTPEGLFTLLKELTKRDVHLRAKTDGIDKFRRWYYPPLTTIPKWKTLTDEEVFDLIGHDDRKFYSDHEVYSSRFVVALDAWNLTSYLEETEEIVHMKYKAKNIMFTKELDCKVSTTKLD